MHPEGTLGVPKSMKGVLIAQVDESSMYDDMFTWKSSWEWSLW